MPSYFYLPSAIRKRPLTTLAATIVLGAGVVFTITGSDGNRVLECYTGTGCIVDNDLEVTGTLTVGGEELLSQSGSDARYVNRSGDTMTGSLLIQSGSTIGTIEANAVLQLASSTSAVLHIESTDTTVADNQIIGRINFFGRDASSGAEGITGEIISRASPSSNAGRRYDMEFNVLRDNNLLNVLYLAGGDGLGGSIGIGTTDPTGILTVVGGIANTGIDGTDITLTAERGGGGNTTAGDIVLVTAVGTGTGSAGNLIFNANLTDTRFFVEGETGEVGIGTTDPQALLEVVGVMSGTTVTASGGAVELQASPFIFPLIASGTSLATGAIVHTFDMPMDGEFFWMHCNVDDPATDGLTEIDVTIAGTSIFSTNITIDGGENDSDSASSPPIIDTSNNFFSQGDKLEFSTPTVSGVTVADGLNCRGVLWKKRVPLIQP